MNQRNVTTKTWENGTYGIDRWISSGNPIISLTDSGINIEVPSGESKSSIIQRIELNNIIEGRAYSASCCIDGIIISGTFIAPSINQNIIVCSNSISYIRFIHNKNYWTYVIEIMSDSTSHTIEWVKLEENECVTPYVSRQYSEEWQLCQRYYQVLPALTAVLCAIKTNDIKFGFLLSFPTRLSKPKLNFDTISLYCNDSNVSGFTFSISTTGSSNLSERWMFVNASKSSHGIKFTSLIGLKGDIFIDAELY